MAYKAAATNKCADSPLIGWIPKDSLRDLREQLALIYPELAERESSSCLGHGRYMDRCWRAADQWLEIDRADSSSDYLHTYVLVLRRPRRRLGNRRVSRVPVFGLRDRRSRARIQGKYLIGSRLWSGRTKRLRKEGLADAPSFSRSLAISCGLEWRVHSILNWQLYGESIGLRWQMIPRGRGWPGNHWF